MAAKKNSISLPFLKEYNIDRKDIIIYGVSLCLFVTALLAFVFISRDISKLKQQRKSKISMLEDYRKLQENKVKIEKENAQLQGRAQALYDRFLADSDINSFSFFVKEIATRYKALNVNIDPQKTFAQEPRTFVMSDEVVDYLVGKNVFDKEDLSPFRTEGRK
ncbi:MAG: hypothetical protein WCI43_00665 [Candidatus Firestonebacteria bacterium]